MVENTFTAYSGTTLENYLRCALLINDEVKFDKLRESRLFGVEVNYEKDFDGAKADSVDLARRLNHFPLVIEGKLEIFYKDRFCLEAGKYFPVDRIYMPKSIVVANLIISETEYDDQYGLFISLSPSIFEAP